MGSNSEKFSLTQDPAWHRLRPDDPRVWQRALTQTEAEEVRALPPEHLPSGYLCFRMLPLWCLLLI